jgi:hypothetical protein
VKEVEFLSSIKRRIVLLITAAILAAAMVSGPAAGVALAFNKDCHGPGSVDLKIHCKGNKDQGQTTNASGKN